MAYGTSGDSIIFLLTTVLLGTCMYITWTVFGKIAYAGAMAISVS